MLFKWTLTVTIQTGSVAKKWRVSDFLLSEAEEEESALDYDDESPDLDQETSFENDLDTIWDREVFTDDRESSEAGIFGIIFQDFCLK